MWVLAYYDTAVIDGVHVIRASGVIQFFESKDDAIKAQKITDIINDDDDIRTMVFPAKEYIGIWHPLEGY
ncbi:TPA: hypothetical protein RG710_000791 [Proteus mirabilis]|uniref:hypothetical protein n=1 Tax=Proteus mirabilis TaxID=584 RepID=UPI000666FD5E|nr:hypothetical protein [Proteus mirabilis]ELZ9703822.1 hypothetical protein [Proteus mirabilis]MBG2907927.1 hypothetical protein [Proteus mirabilis]MBG2928436.1 hypothetical protein [Proteus mirabilis]HCD1093852.1 hypothetical protein [Proteus mirabilis]HCD1098270.1 hypothetical protein [Proteus mirabilis]